MRARVDKRWADLLTPWLWSGRLLLYWLLFFAFFRLWFILWLRHQRGGGLPWEAFWYALPLDISAASYLLLPAIVLAYGSGAAPVRAHLWLARLFSALYFGFILLALAIYGANIFLYEEWHTPINSRAYAHFRIPGAMLSSMSVAFKVGALALLFLLQWTWWRLFCSIVGPLPALSMGTWSERWVGLLLLSAWAVAMRGGLGRLPINESAAYYSSDTFRNHAAVNAGWYFVHNLIETGKAKNRYITMPSAEAQRQVADLLPPPPSHEEPHGWLDPSIARRPNVVVLLLESMSAQLIEALGGIPGVCPNLSRLATEGILFEHCYGSGYRTDQGVVAVLSGFPAQPDHSVVFIPEKARKLPSLARTLRSVGYTTAFAYGGELTFANMGLWLRHQQFEHILSVRDFEARDITQLWGVDDHRFLQRGIQMLKDLPEPFFAVLMTLSLHAPYDVPYQRTKTGRTDREKFLLCASFVDQAIGEFFEKARCQPWYENALFVLVADHGHPLPGGISMDQPRSRHIPLLLCGPVIARAWRGRCVGTLGGHHDVPATLLRELGLDRRAFRWSRDLFDSSVPAFAYYSNENGMGWLTPHGAGFFDFKSQCWRPLSADTLSEKERTQARAYLQCLYDDFLEL